MPTDSRDWFSGFSGGVGVPSGGRAGRGNEATGYIPTIPDPLAEIQKALHQYTTSIPSMINSATAINEANQAAALKQITDLYPQFTQNVKQLGANVADWSKGLLSQNTIAGLTQDMMERGAASGMGPSAGSTNAALMALLGKTREGIQSQAFNAQNTLLSGLPKAPLVDPTKLGISPDALANMIMEGDVYKAITEAAPDPAAAYELAKQNALQGMGAGRSAASGPFAGVPTMGSTSTPANLNNLLRNLMSNGEYAPGVVTWSGGQEDNYIPDTTFRPITGGMVGQIGGGNYYAGPEYTDYTTGPWAPELTTDWGVNFFDPSLGLNEQYPIDYTDYAGVNYDPYAGVYDSAVYDYAPFDYATGWDYPTGYDYTGDWDYSG